MYDEDTFRWINRKTSANILGLYRNNLRNLPKTAKYELLSDGYIVKTFDLNSLEITENGRRLLEEFEVV